MAELADISIIHYLSEYGSLCGRQGFAILE